MATILAVAALTAGFTSGSAASAATASADAADAAAAAEMGSVPVEQPAPPPPTPPSFLVSKLLAPSPPPELAPAVEAVPVDSSAYRSARGQLDEAASALANASRAKDDANRTLLGLAQREAELTVLVDAAGGRVGRETLHLDQLHQAMHQLAVASYITGQGSDTSLESVIGMSPNAVTHRGQQHTMVRSVRHQQVSERRAGEQRLAIAQQQFHDLSAARRTERQNAAETTAERARQTSEQQRWSLLLWQRRQAVKETRALSQVVRAGFPLVVLDAYWKAAQSQPACGIPWWALAGIGRTESGHGTDGGAKVTANGDTERPIVGIALNGTNNTAAIADTDHGLTDGDPFFDRAIGPMQFIPSTWLMWGRDGNVDARIDANNLYDASMGAAAYLCASGPMRADADLVRGFLSYNHDLSYAALVLQRAKTYGLALPLGTPPSSPAGAEPAPTAAPVAKGAAGAPAPPPTTAPLPAPRSTLPAPAPPPPVAPPYDPTPGTVPAPSGRATATAPTSTAPTSTAPTATAPTSTAPTSTAPTATAPTSTAPTDAGVSSG